MEQTNSKYTNEFRGLFQILLLRPDGWYWGNIFEYSTLEIFTQIFHIRTILIFLLQFVKSSDQFGNFGWFWFVLHFCLLNAGYEESSLRIMRWIREFSLWGFEENCYKSHIWPVWVENQTQFFFFRSCKAAHMNQRGWYKAEINHLCKYYN